MTNRHTTIDPDLFARVMALPTSLRHDVLKFLGATPAPDAGKMQTPLGAQYTATDAQDPASKEM